MGCFLHSAAPTLSPPNQSSNPQLSPPVGSSPLMWGPYPPILMWSPSLCPHVPPATLWLSSLRPGHTHCPSLGPPGPELKAGGLGPAQLPRKEVGTVVVGGAGPAGEGTEPTGGWAPMTWEAQGLP